MPTTRTRGAPSRRSGRSRGGAAPQAGRSATARTSRPTASSAALPASQRMASGQQSLVRRAPGLVAMAVMAVLGVGIAIYLTFVHYAGAPLYCPANGIVNCAAVTTSAYSLVPGTSLPITIPGMLWFLVSGGLAAVALRSVWRGQPELPHLRLVHLIWAAAGLIYVLYLVYAEIVLLHHICEWCTGIHLLTFATFLVALMRVQQAPEEL